MLLTLTQAILLYWKILRDSKQGDLIAEFNDHFIKLILDGPSTYSQYSYRLFCQRFTETTSKIPAFKDIKIIDMGHYGQMNSPPPSGAIPINDGFTMPSEYYANTKQYIDSHREKEPSEELKSLIIRLTNDSSRRGFETTLARSILAYITFPDDFFLKIKNWDRRICEFLYDIIAKENEKILRTPGARLNDKIKNAHDWLLTYERLSSVNLDEPEKLDSPETIFHGWRSFQQVPNEVYEIIRLACTKEAEIHDRRFTLQRRENIRVVALSWILLRIIVNIFNDSLHLLNEYYEKLEVENFKGRFRLETADRGDHPIDSQTEWPVREVGTFNARTHLPLAEYGHEPARFIAPSAQAEEIGLDDGPLAAPRLQSGPDLEVLKQRQKKWVLNSEGVWQKTTDGQPYGVPTYFNVSERLDGYKFKKAVDNVIILPDSVWAKLCRDRKVHTLIGAGSGSFFYISRALISTQDVLSYYSLFPPYAREGRLRSPATYLQHDFNQNEFRTFVKVLSSLWVGVTGGHCYFEMLFALNMQPVVKKFQEICNLDSKYSVSSLFNLELPFCIHDVLNIASDFNYTKIVAHYLVLKELKCTVPLAIGVPKPSDRTYFHRGLMYFEEQRGLVLSRISKLSEEPKNSKYKPLLLELSEKINSIQFTGDASLTELIQCISTSTTDTFETKKSFSLRKILSQNLAERIFAKQYILNQLVDILQQLKRLDSIPPLGGMKRMGRL